MKVIFKPKQEANFEAFLTAQKYDRIWQANKAAILKSFKTHTGLNFGHKQLTIHVNPSADGSNSGDTGLPMLLNSQDEFHIYSEDEMLATLLHELAHRLLISNEIRSTRTDYGYQRVYLAHKRIYLFLYDVWVDMLGEEIASEQLNQEFFLGKAYRDAWHWSLDKTYLERQKLISQLK